MKDIEQWKYEIICECLGIPAYEGIGDEVNDIRYQDLGTILIQIVCKFEDCK